MRIKLLVSCLGLIMALIGCSSKTTQLSHNEIEEKLKQGQWRVNFIGQTPVLTGGQPLNHAHLVFSEEDKVYGADGCNRLMGSYSLRGESLFFAKMASTMMACMNQQDVSKELHEALQSVSKLRLHGNHLILLNRDGERLLQLQQEPRLAVEAK